MIQLVLAMAFSSLFSLPLYYVSVKVKNIYISQFFKNMHLLALIVFMLAYIDAWFLK